MPWTLHVYVTTDTCGRSLVSYKTSRTPGNTERLIENRDVIGIRYDLEGNDGIVRATSSFPVLSGFPHDLADSSSTGKST
jgi:hypothetical protein